MVQSRSPASGLERRLESTDNFLFAVEVESGRGPASDKKTAELSARALSLASSGIADLLCMTDNPGGYPHRSSEELGIRLLERGQDVSLTFSCKDHNRNALEGRLWAASCMGFRNVMAVSGDYPAAGRIGAPKPVFDIDSVGLLELIRRMNGACGGGERSPSGETPPNFFPGAVVNPFKRLESELSPQYQKFALKVRTGARWIITQIGFDARRSDELLRFMRRSDVNVPVFGAVFLLNPGAARAFHRGAVPGVVLTDELRSIVESEAAAPDRGRAFFEGFAAKQIAVLKGLGYRGVYISGTTQVERIRRILEIVDSFGPEDWRGFASEIQFAPRDSFFLSRPDAPLEARSNGRAATGVLKEGTAGVEGVSFGLVLGRLARRLAFDPGSPGFRIGRAVYSRTEKLDGRLSNAMHLAERAVKFPLYGCRDCGDCSLPDIADLCPESQCAKNQRNGPCGGSRDGYCEIGRKRCIWVRAYERLKPYGEQQGILERPPVIKNGALQGTSSWANAFLGRDHRAAGEAVRTNAQPSLETPSSAPIAAVSARVSGVNRRPSPAGRGRG
ncbi:MAG: methylenetetrahydrofolate reductase C-terminal domain-containing protein [Chloroflexi bacterium]|nr:methylenetetrahydrofolate reductase C-terminal domain-containing protein [Chloroflexota bacterium]